MNRFGPPSLLILLVASCVAPRAGGRPVVPAADALREAVVADLMADAAFRGDAWFWSDRTRPAYDPEFAVAEAVCHGSPRRATCRFILTRRRVERAADGGLLDRRSANDCRATLERTDGAGRWRIRRFPPVVGGSGHSTSALRCRPHQPGRAR